MTSTGLGRGALYCGLLPLLAGIGIFLLWIPTRWVQLEEAGLFCILGGTAVVVVGLLLLVLDRGAKSPIPGPQAWATLALLLVNFPAAAGIIVLVDLLKYPRIDVAIDDVSHPKGLTLSTRERSVNSLSVFAKGTLEGRARFRMGDRGDWLQVGPGKVDTLIRGGDYFQSEATLEYEPLDVRGGTLRVTYQFR